MKKSFAGSLAGRAAFLHPSRVREFASKAQGMSRSGPPLVDLATGFPDLTPIQPVVEEAGARALLPSDPESPLGAIELRRAIAAQIAGSQGVKVSARQEVTVTAGATEALNAALLTVIQPGDEVIVFEPFFDNYLAHVALAGGRLRRVRLNEPDWTFDARKLQAAFNERTRAIIVNTPHNPTGRVFTRAELDVIARLCQKWGVTAIVDETYAALVYDSCRHLSLASLPGMGAQTVTVGGFTKTFTGQNWRLGYLVAPARVSLAVRDALAFVAPSRPPLVQQAQALIGLTGGGDAAARLTGEYFARRSQLADTLTRAGFDFRMPEGTSFIFARAETLHEGTDLAAWEALVTRFGVAAVPGRCFYSARVRTKRLRFCFARRAETLATVSERLKPLAGAA